MKWILPIAALCAVVAGCDTKNSGAPLVAAAIQPPAAIGWQTYKHTDKFSDKVSYVAELKARSATGVQGELPTLVAICNGRTTDALIDWKSYVGIDQIYVQSRLDSDPARNEESHISSNQRATYMLDAGPKLKEFLRATTYIASVSPSGGNTIFAEFDVSGAEEALKDIRQACNW